MPFLRTSLNEGPGTPFNNLNHPTDIVLQTVPGRLRDKLSLSVNRQSDAGMPAAFGPPLLIAVAATRSRRPCGRDGH